MIPESLPVYYKEINGLLKVFVGEKCIAILRKDKGSEPGWYRYENTSYRYIANTRVNAIEFALIEEGYLHPFHSEPREKI